MPTHAEKRVLPYSQQQMFDLVAQVEKYPEFLPWCLKVRITHQEEDKKTNQTIFFADLVIGYKLVKERFKSKVTTRASEHIHVEYIEGPMKYLSNHWNFTPDKDNKDHCLVDFYVDFQFKNLFFQNLMEVFFDKAVRKMVSAFENRAKDLYG